VLLPDSACAVVGAFVKPTDFGLGRVDPGGTDAFLVKLSR
jgi:hypothetical protein